ncbi:MAG: hydroxyethylthiazole kinase, partial [Chloroflexota bacterium]|nr:hydroxyethylthiazole kinase [Chloroflexota bacterium]
MAARDSELAGAEIKRTLEDIGRQRPLVHAIVNHVVIGAAADAIRAIGALPVMAAAPEEAGDMAAQASALVLNTGTPDRDRLQACLAAGRSANQHGVPIVLDPVGMGSTPWRSEGIRRLAAELRLAAIRGNRSEIAALAGSTGGAVRGVEATGEASLEELIGLARAARRVTGAVICISGETDVIAGEQLTLVRNGHPLMGEVVGTGCMLSAVVAAFVAVERRTERAVAQAVITFGLAGEAAARDAQGPGAFRVALI